MIQISDLKENRIGVKIAGTGMALPSRKVTNDDLSRIVDTSDEWIVQRTGISTRYLLGEREKLEEVAGQSVRQALKAAGLTAEDLDLVICASTRADVLCPALACRIVEQIEAIPCGSFDINVACTGFLTALSTANAFIQSGTCKTVAVVGAEGLSRFINWDDRRTCVLFGDGASCAILQATEDTKLGCLYQSLNSDASLGRGLYIPEVDGDIPDGQEGNYNGKLGTLQMDGRSVYKFAVRVLAESVENALKALDLTANDISIVLPHQSNIRMIESAWSNLGIDHDKIHINIDRYGNTGAASCGICLHECLADGKLKAGDKVIFVAQGGGLSWGAAVWQL